MNEQYSGSRFYNPPVDEKTEKDTNVPAAGWDALADNVPADAALIEATPAGERIVYEAATVEALADSAPADAALIDATQPVDTIVRDAATIEAPYTAPLSPALPGTTAEAERIVHEAATAEALAAGPVGVALPDETPPAETTPHEAPVSEKAGLAALLSGADSEHFRTRWNEIQGTFVDDPRTAVQHADVLVTEAVEKITQMFAGERSTLEGQWKLNNDVSTEDLRKALQQYRSFFNRLVG